MMKKYTPLIIIWVILFCLSLLGYFIFKKLGVPILENICGGAGLITATLLVYYLTRRDIKKSKDIEDIKEELKAKVDYEKIYKPKMEQLDLRISSKADKASVDGFHELVASIDKKLDILISKGK